MRLKKTHCTNCGGMLDLQVNENCTQIFCPYCGTVYEVDQRKKEIVLTHNIHISERYTNDADVIRAKAESKENRHNFLLILAFFGLVAIIFFSAIYQFEISDFFDSFRNKGKIRAGNYFDYNDLNYQAVETQLSALGFTNIVLIDLGNSNDRGVPDGEVESITINGDSTFWSEDYFYPNDTVIIRYH